MQRTVIALVVFLLIGAVLGALVAWKALGWRRALLEMKSEYRDYAGIGIYPKENAAVAASGRRPDVVLIGASHTRAWGDGKGRFPGLNLANRGIGGQLVPQYLLRFRQDVLDLHPKAVVIEGCFINALYEVPLRTLVDSYDSMAELARTHGIEPILTTTMPVDAAVEGRSPGTNAQVRRINEAIRDLARSRGYLLVDYYATIASTDGLLPSSDSTDGAHCGPRVYDLMAQSLRPVLDQALGRRAGAEIATAHP
jgi:lysophospholipase L1-like esterase